MNKSQEVAKANYTVYQHVTPNGKVYIGITKMIPKNRWRGGEGYYKNEHFYNAIKKYGWDNIEHNILMTNLTQEEALKKEREFVLKFKSNDRNHGYNLTNGGDGIGTVTEEAKEKIRKANLGNKFTEERKQHLRENHADVSGENNPNFGKKWTQEQIAIRQSHRVYFYGGENPSARKICQCLDDGTVIKIWGSISEASKEYCRTSVKDCLKGKLKHHRGYVWRYYDEKQ